VTAPGMNGQARLAEQALTGIPMARVAAVLSQFSAEGRDLAAVLDGSEGRLR
jgi:hypothetical protein